MFSCDVNRCITPDLLCNGEIDCLDGSDEDKQCTGKEITDLL